MKAAETKHTSPARPSPGTRPFFQKEGGENTFFSDRQTDIQTKPFFGSRATQLFIQPKLTIGRPGDKYEQEADVTADRVVQRLSDPETIQTNPAASLANTVTPLVQPKCAICEQEEQIQKKEEEEGERLEETVQRKPVFESGEPPPEEEEIQRKCAECPSAEASAKEGEAEEKVQRSEKADSSANGGASSLESRLNASRSSGSPLPEETQTQMESSFGADFGNVRVHTGSSAVQMNQELHAQAFTHRSDIYFNSGKYNPESTEGKHLLAHELTHTIQQDNTARNKLIQRTLAEDLIESHTSWGDLDENALGSDLKDRAIQGDYSFVNSVFDELGWMNLDDVAYELIKASSDTELDVIAGGETGRSLLDRLYDFLTAGNLSQEEQTQSDRILVAKSRQMNVEEFPQDIDDIKIFPFRLPGITVLSDAPITAERRSGGIIHVEMPVRVLGTEGFRDETRTLPDQTFISGIDLPENEIVGIKLYDLGGLVVFKPALYLIRLSNETTTQVISAMIEAAGIGLTLGAGEFIVLGAKATMAARAVLWADRAAFILGTLTTVINEHRGWIISTFGDAGRDFVYYNSLVNAAVAIYGIGRMVYGLGQLLNNFRRVYNNWRGSAGGMELETGNQSAINEIQSQTDEFLENADNLSSTRRPDAPELDVETPTATIGPEEAGTTPRAETASSVEEAADASALRPTDSTSGNILTQAEDGVRIGGRRHGLSIKITDDGRVVVQVCTDCDGIIHIITEALRDPEIASNPDLVDDLRRINDDAFDVQTAVAEGRMTEDAANTILQDLKRNLEDLAEGNEHPLTPYMELSPAGSGRHLTEQEALDIINGIEDMRPVQIDEMLTRHLDDPVLLGLLRRRGTLIDSHFRSEIVGQLRQDLPQNILFTPTDSSDLKNALGLDELPWTSGNGPDLVLIDTQAKKISVLDLTSTENAQHLRSKQAQAEELWQMLGDEWTLQGVRDFYHRYKFIGLEETVEQIGDVLRLFGFNG